MLVCKSEGIYIGKRMKKRHGIKDNALKAQLRTPMFKLQQQTPKKGKGSYSRKGRGRLTRSIDRGHRQAA
ncbi:alternative ribosome rescue factor ArfA [Halomonas sp. C22]|uniref:alternative ribosome rescue factor ArfA n=1 Tax=Halomonas sp. C22 TaxID=2580567 RepID=UPI0028CB3F06|nr:alternative ribosome rescue factor ArfA [Halomonas sp. C22]